MIIIKNEARDPKSGVFNDSNIVISGTIVGIVVGEHKFGADYQDYMKNHCYLGIHTDEMENDVFTISSSEGLAFGVHAFVVEARVLTDVGGKMKTILKKELLVPFVGAIACNTRYRSIGFLVTLGINNIIKEAQNAALAAA